MKTIFSTYKRKKYSQFIELNKLQLKRSEAAKKGWITRRANQQKKKEPIIRRIFKPEDMVRNVWGTNCSDKNVPFSFTFFTFSKENLDGNDSRKCEDKFINLIDYWIRQHYPNRSYSWRTAEADGWFTEMIRREENISVSFDGNYYLKWLFEINGTQEDIGDLNDIV